MKKESIEKLGTLAAPLGKGEVQPPDGYVPAHHGHGDSATSIRRATHCGREIEIHTTYKILVDGEPVREHIVALEDGTIHYHGLPNYSFPSAVEMARRIVERSLVPRPKDELNPSESYGEHHR